MVGKAAWPAAVISFSSTPHNRLASEPLHHVCLYRYHTTRANTKHRVCKDPSTLAARKRPNLSGKWKYRLFKFPPRRPKLLALLVTVWYDPAIITGIGSSRMQFESRAENIRRISCETGSEANLTLAFAVSCQQKARSTKQ